MNFLARSLLRFRWLNVPAAVLVALLQRTPVLRLLVATEQVAAPSSGAIVRNVLATAAALGGVHALAGATQLSPSVASPFRATVGTSIPTIAMTVTGAQSAPGSFRVTGPIPPGLAVSGLTGSGGTVNTSTLLMSGTPTAAGTYTMTIRAYERVNLGGDTSSNFTYTVIVAEAAATAPTFSTQPVSQTVNAGASVTLTAVANGSPTPALQWRRDGLAISGATSTTLQLTNVQPADAGDYTLVATNSAGSLASSVARLTVNTPVVVPVFVAEPVSVSVASGSTVAFSAAAPGATSYQWQRDGADLAGATSATLVLSPAQAVPGNYRVIARNAAGAVTSGAATLARTTSTDTGRLINLSILTTAGAGAKVLTMGAVVGPLTSNASLPLVIRAVGPTLAQAPFNIPGVLDDPVMSVFTAGASVPMSANDNWGGATDLEAEFRSVGAFALPRDSLDSAVVRATPGVGVGGYTVQVTSKNGASGLVIAEVYDAAGAERTAETPRLINLSTLTQIDAGSTLAMGFVLGGQSARTVLVRAVGPSLGVAPFNIGGVMADPVLELYDNSTGRRIATNDNWGGAAELTATVAAVGAFPLADAATKDAVLVITLPPGPYSARVNGAASAGGTAIVEVYDVP